MSQLEKHLLDRVRPLKPEKAYYPGNTQVIPNLTELPHNHQKGKQCRSCRTLRKIAKEEKQTELRRAAIEHGTGLLKELILAGGYTAGQGLNALGQWGRGYAENGDPVSQLAALGTGIIAFEWFKASFPGFSKTLHLDGLFFVEGPGGDLPNEQPNGQFCVRIKTLAGVESHKCYATGSERDKAHGVLTSQSFGLYTVTDYEQLGGKIQYCVRADGLNNARIDQCFNTTQERDDFVKIGLATRRIANPEEYQTVVAGSTSTASIGASLGGV